MILHLVGGFLGSGKTTAIIQACRAYLARGVRPGVVTNDQGRYLVDTAFFRAGQVPAVEVTGGCFCCNYADLGESLRQLEQDARPDVIFAESVGSCADLVATVLRPLLSLAGDTAEPRSLSVFADARLLLRRLRGDEMPFSDDVMYIFDQQIEEAGLIVVNKKDLLVNGQARVLKELIDARYPGRPVHFQDSRNAEMVAGWLEKIEGGMAPGELPALSLDYARYTSGETRMAWLDARLHFERLERGDAIDLLQGLSGKVRAVGGAVGHLKVALSVAGLHAKISLPSLEEPGWESRVPEFERGPADMLLNLRAEVPSESLQKVFHAEMSLQNGVSVLDLSVFHPDPPRPTHRML